jgi:hypothetical protein
MNLKSKKQKMGIYTIAFLSLFIIVAPALGRTFLSTDIPMVIDGMPLGESDVCTTDGADLSPFLPGDVLGLAAGVNLTAFGFGGPDILFAVDVPATIDGQRFTPRQVIGFDGSHCSVYFDGDDGWIPEHAIIDAVAELPDGRLLLSLDVPTEGAYSSRPNDLLYFDQATNTVGTYFPGNENGLPPAANMDGAWVREDGDLLFSVDIPVQLDGTLFKANDVIQWDGAAFSRYLEGESVGLPANSDIDALALPGSGVPCPGDFDPPDGDVDGSDLAELAADPGLLALSVFSETFGRADCPVSLE